MPRSKARRSAAAALAKLYESLPRVECRGLCHDSCGPIGMTTIEQAQMEDAHGGPLPPHMPAPDAIQAIRCPLLTADKRCSIYRARPLICRLWGVVDDDLMRCPHGCRPVPRYLTNHETQAIFAKADAISARYEEESHAHDDSA